jgi:two-component sensor histidine kinase
VPTGTLDVSSSPPGNEAVIVWTERGGPPVTAPKGKGGFGSKLIVRSLKQIGGSIERSWQREGVVVTMKIDKDSLST